ncbi:MAG: hypothetical protein WD534_16985 [Phycisphaeraceae bacterium]
MNLTLAATVLTITLSTQGHWLADRPGTVSVAWVAPEQAVDAVLDWQLTLDALPLAAGRLELDGNDEATALTIDAPAVRVPTTLKWSYQLHADDDGRRLGEGGRTLRLYPDPLAGLAERVTEPVVVVGEGEPATALTDVLEQADVPHRQADRAATLQLTRPGIVLVVAGHLEDAAGETHALTQLARSGASVMLFEQQTAGRLFDHRLRRRPPPTNLDWQTEHALLRHLDAGVRASWLSPGRDLWAIERSADRPGRALAAWPDEGDALALTRPLGRGRLVLWQLPLGPWADDPRSRQLLVNALDDLGARPAPADEAPPARKPDVERTRP